MEHRPEEAKNIIELMNSKTREELEDLNIPNITAIVIEVKRILTNKKLVIQLENKRKDLELQLKRLNKNFTLLQEKGLPTLRTSNGQLIPLENYKEQLCNTGIVVSMFTKAK